MNSPIRQQGSLRKSPFQNDENALNSKVFFGDVEKNFSPMKSALKTTPTLSKENRKTAANKPKTTSFSLPAPLQPEALEAPVSSITAKAMPAGLSETAIGLQQENQRPPVRRVYCPSSLVWSILIDRASGERTYVRCHDLEACNELATGELLC